MDSPFLTRLAQIAGWLVKGLLFLLLRARQPPNSSGGVSR